MLVPSDAPAHRRSRPALHRHQRQRGDHRRPGQLSLMLTRWTFTGSRVRILDIDAPESRQPCTRARWNSEWRCGQSKPPSASTDWIGGQAGKLRHNPEGPDTGGMAGAVAASARLTLPSGWRARAGYSRSRDCKCEVIQQAPSRARQGGGTARHLVGHVHDAVGLAQGELTHPCRLW